MVQDYKKIGVILVNYNESTLDTIECVNSLLNSGCMQEQIYILDNNSVEKYKDLLRRNISGNVAISFNSENSGFAKGCNIGIKYFLTREDISYILLLNNDTVVPANFLKDLMAPFLDPDPTIGIVAPLIYYYGNKDELWYGGVNYRPLLGCYVHNTDKSKIPMHSYVSTDVATGCCMLFRKELVGEVGFLDEDYFMYIEDVDFSLRIRRAGLKILLNTNTHVYHKLGKSSAEISLIKSKYLFNSGRLFIRKNYTGFRRMFYFCMSYIANIHGGIKLFFNGRVKESMIVFRVLLQSIHK